MDHRNTQIIIDLQDVYNALADRFNDIVVLEACDNDLFTSQQAIVKVVFEQIMKELQYQFNYTFTYNVTDDASCIVIKYSRDDISDFISETKLFCEDYFCILFNVEEIELSVNATH
jgi:hypothetical protein